MSLCCGVGVGVGVDPSPSLCLFSLCRFGGGGGGDDLPLSFSLCCKVALCGPAPLSAFASLVLFLRCGVTLVGVPLQLSLCVLVWCPGVPFPLPLLYGLSLL